MKRVLVTGSEGQLGMTIKEMLGIKKEGFEFDYASKSQLDITSIELVDRIFDGGAYDYCINCAAYTNVEQAEKTPQKAFDVNAEAVKNLAIKCKQVNTVLIHISTDYVFDGNKKTAYTLKDTPNPINEYGKSKLLGEQHIQELMTNYFIIRTSWLYSKKYGHNFYRTIMNKSQTEETLYVTTQQLGCPTNTRNLVSYIFEIIKNEGQSYGLKHFCDGQSMTWYDFAHQILKENNLEDKINLVKGVKYLTFAKRPKNSVLCLAK